MNEEIKKYIKENLKIGISTSNDSNYRGDGHTKINIEITLEGELISEDYDIIDM